MKMLRLPRAKVQLGQPLPWSVRDENGRLLLTRGHVVSSEAQLDALLDRGAFVDVEEIKAAALQVIDSERARAVVTPPNLFDLWKLTGENLQRLLQDVERQQGFEERLERHVDHLIGLIDSHPDIALYQCVRQERLHLFYYGYHHAVHTALLCLLVARQLAWPGGRTRCLVKAALTMNLGILDLQGEMAAQEVPMRERQRAAIQAHPDLAVDRLRQAGVTDPDWLEAVAQHHERPDGSGYPRQLRTPGEMAVALRVTDVFMAKISPRVLRPPLSPQEAVRQLYREDQGGPLSTAVVKVFGLYPPGDLVKLASGEWGVVVERTRNAKAPIVASITDKAGHPVPRTERRDTQQAAYAIVGTATDKALVAKLPPERLFGFAQASDELIQSAQAQQRGGGNDVAV